MIEVKVLSSSSKGNCYRVTDGRTSLLLEAGINHKAIRQGLNHKLTDIAGCLITHEHGDHSKSVKDVVRSSINCYMSAGTKEAIGIQHHRIKTVAAKEIFSIDSWTILPFEVEHDVCEPLGFLLMNRCGEKLLFATDTYYIRYRFKGLTHILVECNYSEEILDEKISEGSTPPVMKKRLLQSHFSLENVKEFLKANDLTKTEQIWLLHLSDSHSNEEQFKNEVMRLTGIPTYIA